MRMPLHTLLLNLLILAIANVQSLDNGVAVRPPLGWSSWLTFRYALNDTLVRSSADFLASSRIGAAGYNYILLDDGWTTCNEKSESGACLDLPPRDSKNRIPIDQEKFPNGFKPLTDYVHSKGLKVGIYTAVANRTCGGYWGSLGYEAIDAEAFAEWGFDFVKHDTCSPGYCGVYNDQHRDGTGKDGNCIKHSATLMSKALEKYDIVYYIDHGNPTSPQKVYNPKMNHVPTHVPPPSKLIPGSRIWKDSVGMNSLALRPSQLSWTWGADVSHMMKFWNDREDTWLSFLSNIHSQIRLEEYQHSPDGLTVGMGGLSPSQNRAQFLMYAILSAPLIIFADLHRLSDDEIDLLTAPEVLQVNQDADCVQASLTQARKATEVWVKPLADSTFAVVLLNKGNKPANVTITMATEGDGSDFFPAYFNTFTARNLLKRENINNGREMQDVLSMEVDGMDAIMIKISPIEVAQEL